MLEEPPNIKEVMDRASRKTRRDSGFLDRSESLKACFRRLTALEERYEYLEERLKAAIEYCGPETGEDVDVERGSAGERSGRCLG